MNAMIAAMKQQIEKLISSKFPEANVHIEGDGYHFIATVVSDAFAGRSLVQRQQAVYACVNEQIASGDIHALTLHIYTPEELARRQEKSLNG